MAKRIFVVTVEGVRETGVLSCMFVVRSDAPSAARATGHWGFIKLEPKDTDEVDMFKLVRREPNAIGPDGVLRWRVFCGAGGLQKFYGTVEAAPPDEKGLQSLLKEAPDCTLLMERTIFSRFEAACIIAGIEIEVFHFPGELITG